VKVSSYARGERVTVRGFYNCAAVRIAITRSVSPRIVECELTFRERTPIDYARAVAQHRAYEQALEGLGCTIVHAAELPLAADGVFVEDAAIVLDEIAVVTRPGAESRRYETDSIARILQQYRPVEFIREPGSMDGGDVLCIGRTIHAGRSQRTNDNGIAQFRAIVTPHGYDVVATPFRGCLHLKSAATNIGVLLFNPKFVEARLFGDVDVVAVHPSEPDAGNALRIGATILMSSSWPRTRELIELRGLRVVPIHADELEKAESGVTCCSVILGDSSMPVS
jgi:dimethylargininase